MKQLLIIFCAIVFPLGAQAEWGHPRYNREYSQQHFWNKVDRRMHRQENRIEKGLYEGSLTHKEYRRLQKKRCKLSDRINDARYKRHLSDYDKRRIMSGLDKSSDKIYRLKHNRRHVKHRYNDYDNRDRRYRNDRKVIWTDYGSGGFYFRF